MPNDKTMLTDFYQLSMNAAYHDNRKDTPATFDLFFRELPPDWGYYIANGIEDAVDYVTSIGFNDEDISYLRTHGFKEDYLTFLKSFTFEGDMVAVAEGTPVFPSEPLLRVTAKRTQAQFIETGLLNLINFQTMIATKACRVVHAAAPAGVADFGLRRAQGEDAGLKGARAAYLAGAVATSNVKAGRTYDIPVSGTQAHSFVMTFATELEAFRAYVKTFPDHPTLLIDTYDTVQGARNACIVARELEQTGHRLGGVRLDSGDLAVLSKKVRKILDEHSLGYVKIVASSDLNEYRIHDLVQRQAPIDAYGVGTELITAKPVAAIPGVYKLCQDSDGPKIKLSTAKATLPGKKQVFRQAGSPPGLYGGDIIALEQERVDGRPLLELVVQNGHRVKEKQPLRETRKQCVREFARLPEAVKRIENPETYTVRPAAGLKSLSDRLTQQYQGEPHEF